MRWIVARNFADTSSDWIQSVIARLTSDFLQNGWYSIGFNEPLLAPLNKLLQISLMPVEHGSAVLLIYFN